MVRKGVAALGDYLDGDARIADTHQQRFESAGAALPGQGVLPLG